MLCDPTQDVLCGFKDGQNKYGNINKNSGCIKTVWDGHVHTAVFKMGDQYGPTIQHRELCLTSRGKLE